MNGRPSHAGPRRQLDRDGPLRGRLRSRPVSRILSRVIIPLLATESPSALLVSKSQRAAESDGAEQRASDHEGAPAPERQLALGRRAGRRKLRSVEEIGVETLVLVIILRRAARGFRRTQRDLRRLIVDRVEGLELPPRVAFWHLLAIVGCGLVGEGFEALIGMAVMPAVRVGTMGILMAGRLGAGKDLVRETCVEAVLLLLREVGVGEARLGETRVPEVLVVARFGVARIGIARIARARFGEARIGEALVPI